MTTADPITERNELLQLAADSCRRSAVRLQDAIQSLITLEGRELHTHGTSTCLTDIGIISDQLTGLVDRLETEQ